MVGIDLFERKVLMNKEWDNLSFFFILYKPILVLDFVQHISYNKSVEILNNTQHNILYINNGSYFII